MAGDDALKPALMPDLDLAQAGDVLATAAEWRDAGKQVALATVVSNIAKI